MESQWTTGVPTDAAELRSAPQFERIGVERIDEDAQASKPWTFFALFIGGSVGLGNILFGWIPITLGLGIWGAVSSMVVGTLIALPLIVPLIVIGSRTATNNSTASGAHFGVRGRLVGSFVGLMIMIVFTAVSIWAGGQAVVGVLARLFDTPAGDGALAIAYAAVAILVVLIAVYGYHLLMRATTLLAVFGGLIAVLMLAAFAGDLNLSYSGGGYFLGSFWKTWLLAVTISISGVLVQSTIMGDWTRYISPSRYPSSKLVPIASLGIFLGLTVPPSIGALVAVTFADPFADFVPSLISTGYHKVNYWRRLLPPVAASGPGGGSGRRALPARPGPA